MASQPNETSLSPSNGTDSLLLYAKALAEFIGQHRSFFNVPRENTAIFILILLIKNAIVCYGISNLMPVGLTVKLLVALTCYSLLLLAGGYVINFTVIWGSFAAILCFSSGVTTLPTTARFLISVTTLCVAPIFFCVPCTLESIIDIFLIVHVSVYILKSFLGRPVEAFIQILFYEVTAMMILLAVDIAFDAKGSCFMVCNLIAAFFPVVVETYSRGDILYFLVFSFLFCYCFFEQILIYNYRLANITQT